MAEKKTHLAVLAKAFRASISPQCLGLALAGLLAVMLSWRLVGMLLLPEMDPGSAENLVTGAVNVRDPYFLHGVVAHLPASSGANPIAELALIARELTDTGTSTDVRLAAFLRHPSILVFWQSIEPVRRLFLTGQSWTLLFYYGIGALVSVAIWAVAGGAISRMVVLRCGKGEAVPIRDALAFGWRHATDIIMAVVMPVVAIALMAVPLVAVGLAMRLDLGVVLSGVLWPVALLIGLLMAVLSLGLLFGWPLMWGAIAAESSDAFDAISRSYGYTYQSPLQYLLYAAWALLLATLGWVVAFYFAEAIVGFAYWSVEWGCGAARLAEIRSSSRFNATGALSTGVGLMNLCNQVTLSLVTAFIWSFFWSASSAIYLLLRYDTDETELDDIVEPPAATAAENTSA